LGKSTVFTVANVDPSLFSAIAHTTLSCGIEHPADTTIGRQNRVI